jgi:hypothetical protein
VPVPGTTMHATALPSQMHSPQQPIPAFPDVFSMVTLLAR